jgi:hypothetical protein
VARISSNVHGAVRVEGLAELRKSLGDIGGKPLQKHFRNRMLKVGESVVAPAIREKIPVKTGRSRASIKAGVSGNKAYVQGGKATVPWFGWLDFGGTLKPVGGRKNTIVRARPKGGRYIYPTIHEKQPQIVEAAADAFDDTARELGLK